MGCSASVATTPAGEAAPKKPLSAQELKAQESAKRIADMMAELGIEQGDSNTFRKSLNTKLLDALQRQWYGVALGMPDELFTPYLKATLAIAAADGLDLNETRWLRNRTMLLGLTPTQSSELLAFDFRSAAIEPILAELGGADKVHGANLLRAIFYDACTMAAQDGFSLDEHVRAMKAAELLKVDEDTKTDIEMVVEAEEQLQKRKAALFEGIARAVGREREHRADALVKRAAMQRLCYGVEVPLNSSLEQRYVATLLAVAGADGLSTAEEAWVRDRAAILGLPPQALDTALSSATAAATMPAATGDEEGGDDAAAVADAADARTSFVATADGDKAAATAMLLDATLLAAQDGLSDAEAQRSEKAAEQLGLDAETALEVKAIAEEERRILQKKVSIFGMEA